MAKQKKLLQWHAAFFAGIQIELEAEEKHLIFENEHMLGTRPMQMDVLIIKKDSSIRIKKNIGRIFKTHNIVEYKSPEDYLSVNDFYKVYGYACFYKADTRKEDEIKISELTVTYACNRYPRKMLRHLRDTQGMLIEKQEAGIYYIKGGLFPIQLLVTTELSEESNFWLRNLTNNLRSVEAAEKVVNEYGKHQNDILYSAMMDVIVQANEEKFKEVEQMCNALLEILEEKAEKLAETRAEVLAEAKAEVLAKAKVEELVKKKIRKKKSVEQIADELEEEVEVILPVYNRVLERLATAE